MISIQNENDLPEAQYEALYRTANYAGWREGALHLIVLSTDAPFHDSTYEPAYPGKSSFVALAALSAKKIKVIGLRTGDTQGYLEYVVSQTGGLFFELSSDSSGITTAISQMIGKVTTNFTVEYVLVGGGEFKESISPTADT